MNNDFSTMTTKPKFCFFLVEHEDGWMAIGSRQINYLDLESIMASDSIFTFGGDRIPLGPPSYNINGSFETLIMAVNSSPLSALASLYEALQKEEAEEVADTKRREDLARFGGEINEELIRKIVKWRKKQEKKQPKEYEYHEWDEY